MAYDFYGARRNLFTVRYLLNSHHGSSRKQHQQQQSPRQQNRSAGYPVFHSQRHAPHEFRKNSDENTDKQYTKSQVCEFFYQVNLVNSITYIDNINIYCF